MRTDKKRRQKPSLLSLLFRRIAAPQQIIHTDAVEVGQCAQDPRRYHSLSALVIGIGTLGYIDGVPHRFLGQVVIFPQVTDSLVSFHFYHRYQYTLEHIVLLTY